MIVVTGGAGFIGSALCAALNRRGRTDLWIVDAADHPEKPRTLAALQYETCLGRDDFFQKVLDQTLPAPEAVFHLGACSSTTETDVEFLTRNNVQYTETLARYCLSRDVRFIYASSAATYGDGTLGYEDDESRLETLRPLNPYGQSKQTFDLIAKREGWLRDIVGLKYFNVYGPNEYHKEDMRSMVLKGFHQVRDGGKLRLFRSHRPEYEDGGQVRDFLYIADAVDMTLFFLDHPEANGIFNVGSGEARSWNALAAVLFAAMDKPPVIEYFPMPESIRDQYQYHTEARMGKIRRAGWAHPATPLEAGVGDYVRNYLLENDRRLGEPSAPPT